MSEKMREFTCISCPLGCQLTVTVDEGRVTKVEGSTCRRGERYAEQEALHPVRMVTSLVDVAGCDMPVSCKTCEAISKGTIDDCLRTLRGIELQPPVHRGDVIVKDICGTGVDVIATKDAIV